jgi:AhpD family alkylhydroperoxidase
MTATRIRLNLDDVAPGTERVGALDTYVGTFLLEASLLDLVRLRASQINGCHLCMAMHARDLRTANVPVEKLDTLPGWRESPWFTPRERAALAWTEAITLVTDGDVADTVYDEARSIFDGSELAALTLAVIAINSWNRLALAVRMQPAGVALEEAAA